MATQMLCGDEVRAAVIDLGFATSKFGTAGQDLPRHIIRSDVGELKDGRGYVVGDLNLRHVKDDLEVSTPYSQDGIFHWKKS